MHYRTMYSQPVCKISSQYICFGCAMAKKKTGKGDNVTFWKAVVASLIVVRQNKGHFWNPEMKLDKMDMFKKINFEFQNVTFLPDFDLNLTWPWVRCKN